MGDAVYIHGTTDDEQGRLARLGDLTNEAFLRFLEHGPESSVLDVGSGLGGLARLLALRIPDGQVWGAERSPEQLARASENLPNLHFRQADAHALPFEDGSFDLAYCRYLLEHVSDPRQVLREMRRVLKPGGKVFVQENDIFANRLDPDCPTFDRVWRQFAGLQASYGGDALIGKRLLRLLNDAGFRDVRLGVAPEVHYAGTPTFRPWVENLIGNIRSAEQGLVAGGFADADDVREAMAELRRVMDDPSGSAFFYWNRAVGVN